MFAVLTAVLIAGCASTPQSRDQGAFVQACVNDWFRNKDPNMSIEIAYQQSRQVTFECKKMYRRTTAR